MAPAPPPPRPPVFRFRSIPSAAPDGGAAPPPPSVDDLLAGLRLPPGDDGCDDGAPSDNALLRNYLPPVRPPNSLPTSPACASVAGGASIPPRAAAEAAVAWAGEENPLDWLAAPTGLGWSVDAPPTEVPPDTPLANPGAPVRRHSSPHVGGGRPPPLPTSPQDAAVAAAAALTAPPPARLIRKARTALDKGRTALDKGRALVRAGSPTGSAAGVTAAGRAMSRNGGGVAYDGTAAYGGPRTTPFAGAGAGGSGATPLEKFVRRAEGDRASEDDGGTPSCFGGGVWGHLSDDYYGSGYDPTLELLRSVPWDEGEDVMDAYLSNKISIYDVAKDQLMQHITDRCQEDCERFFEALRVAHELAVDCERAHMHVGLGTLQLSRAADGSSVAAGLALVSRVRARARLEETAAVLEVGVRTLLAAEEDILTKVAAGEFGAAIDAAAAAAEEIEGNPSLGRLDCLAPLRSRLGSVPAVIGENIETQLESMCRSTFCAQEYSVLLEARIRLDWYVQREGPDLARAVPTASTFAVRVRDYHAAKVGDSHLAALRSVLGERLRDDDDDHNDFRENMRHHGASELLARVEGRDVPAAFFRLCVSVAEILHQYFMFLQWHRHPFDKRNEHSVFLHCARGDGAGDGEESVESEVSEPVESADGDNDDWHSFLDGSVASVGGGLILAREDLWRQCEGALVRTLGPALRGGGAGGGAGVSDLVSVLDMGGLMAALGREFCGAPCRGLGSALEGLKKGFYAGMHGEAVGVIGEMVRNETWDPVPAEHIAGEYLEKKENGLVAFVHLMQKFTNPCVPRRNEFPENLLNTFLSDGNPVLKIFGDFGSTTGGKAAGRGPPPHADEGGDTGEASGTKTANPALPLHLHNGHNGPGETDRDGASKEQTSQQQPVIDEFWDGEDGGGACAFEGATHTLVNGLARWAARYLQAMEVLPSMRRELSIGITRLFDLYFMSVLRLSTGCEDAEDALFNGESDKRGILKALSEYHDEYYQCGSSRQMKTAIGDFLEADICAPLPSEKDQFAPLRWFINRAHDALGVDGIHIEGFVPSFVTDRDRMDEPHHMADLLQRRCSAAESCKFAMCLIMTAKSISRSQGPVSNSEDFLGNYAKVAITAVPLLAEISVRLAGVRAAGAKRVVRSVLEVGRKWERAGLGEGCNPYVEQLGDRCVSIWRCMAISPRRFPVGVVDVAWANLVDGALNVLLEAFSKVVLCSTEGRALMSMDHASFISSMTPAAVMDWIACQILPNEEDEIEGILRSPQVVPRMGKQYVDLYISAFYFDEKDVIRWILDNRGAYRLRHSCSLIICGIGGRTKKQRVQQIVGQIEAIYSK